MNTHYDLGSVIIGVVGAIVGLTGIGYAVGTHSKLSRVSEKLDQAIDDLADRTEIDISESIINQAVKEAVANAADKAVKKATDDATKELKHDIHHRVSEAIKDEYDTLNKDVLKRITEESSKIDVNRVRRTIEDAAKKAALEKFDDNLDDILERFNENLNNTSKIYTSISQALTKSPNSGKEYVIRLD